MRNYHFKKSLSQLNFFLSKYLNRTPKYLERAFTLIELLVVIAILGIIIAAVVAGIDPADKIRAANDAKVQADIGTIGTAFETNAVGSGTARYEGSIAALVTGGDLKVAITPPSGYCGGAYTVVNTTAGNVNATQEVYCKPMTSRRFTNACTGATPQSNWVWCSSTGRVGLVCTATGAVPGCP